MKVDDVEREVYFVRGSLGHGWPSKVTTGMMQLKGVDYSFIKSYKHPNQPKISVVNNRMIFDNKQDADDCFKFLKYNGPTPKDWYTNMADSTIKPGSYVCWSPGQLGHDIVIQAAGGSAYWSVMTTVGGKFDFRDIKQQHCILLWEINENR